MLLTTLRLRPHRQATRRLFELDLFARFIATDPLADVFSHVSHRHFLSRTLSFTQRIHCALNHFAFEDQRYGESYAQAVYGARGLMLWHSQAEGVRYTLWLRSPRELRHEGPLSVVLLADDLWLHETSLAWVDAALFGQPALQGPMMFITRNQSARFDAPAVVAFRRSFPQNSPPYFCLAAIFGIAELHGSQHIAGIKGPCQIAFDAPYASSFQSSYADFWQSFRGVELDQHAFMMPAPLCLPPLSEVKAKHRSRARVRRLHWERISQAALQVLTPHRRLELRQPVDREAA